jgi:2-aminomuconate deaminase
VRLSLDDLGRFARDGYIVVPDVVPEPLLAAADLEIDGLIDATAPHSGDGGFGDVAKGRAPITRIPLVHPLIERATTRTAPTTEIRASRRRCSESPSRSLTWRHDRTAYTGGEVPAQRSVVVPGRPSPRGAYPHVRIAGDLLFVSGTSARQPDDTIAGAAFDPDGRPVLDIRVQTRAVLENIGAVLAAVGASLADVVEVTSFLVDMDDFDGYNEVYAEYFSAEDGPARTTIAVRQLPHPHLLVEIKAVAERPVDQP